MSIRGITVKVGGDTTALTAAIRDVSQQSYKLYQELRKVETQLKFDPHHVELLAQKQAILTGQVDETRKKLETLKEAQKSVNEQYEKGEIPVEKYRAFERELVKTESQLKNYEKQLKEATAAAVPLNARMQELSEKVKGVGQKASEVGGSLSKTLSVPLLGIATVAAKVGMEFESAMSKVKAYSGANAQEMEKLEEAARDAGAATSKNASQAADALGYMSLAGWDVKDSIEGLMPVLRLSEAGNIDLARASSLVTDSMSALGLTTKELPGYLDTVAQAARSSNTDIDQMTEAYIRVGGTLRGLNVPLDESAVALGMLANAGIKGGEAGTALNAVLLNLTAPVGRAKEALDGLNYSAFDSEGNFKGLEQVLFDVRDMTAGMTEEQRNLTLSMIGGKNHTKDLNALLNVLGDSYADLKQAVAESDGALDDMAKTMMDNAQGSLIELKSALEELALKVYDVIQPAIKGLIGGIKTFVQWLDNLSPAVQRTIVVVGGIVAAIGPALVIFGKLTSGVGSAISMFGKLAGFVQATLIPAITGISLPAVATVGAIAALAAVAYEVYRAWDEVKTSLSATWEYLKAQAEKMGLAISITFEEMKNSLLSSIDAILEKFAVLEKLPFGWGEKFKGISDFVGDSADKSAAKLTELKERAEENAARIGTATDNMKVSFKDLGTAVVDDIKLMVGKLKGQTEAVEEETEKQTKTIRDGEKEKTETVKEEEKERTEIIKEETEEQRKARESIEADWNKKLFDLTATRMEKLEAEYVNAIREAEKYGADTLAIEAYYALKKEELQEKELEELLKHEREKQERKAKFQDDWAKKAWEHTATEIERLNCEKENALEQAEELGADKTKIIEYYSLLEKDILDRQADEDEKRQKEKIKSLREFEQGWNDKLFKLTADRVKVLEKERDEQIKIAKELGAETSSLRAYYEKLITDEQKKQADEREERAREEARVLKATSESWAESYMKIVDSVAMGAKTIKEVMKELLINVVNMLEKEMIAHQLAELAKAWARSWWDWTAVLRAGAAIAASTVAFEGAKALIRGLKTGGIVRGGADQIFRLGDGREDEAVLPLSPAIFRQLAAGITKEMHTTNHRVIEQNITIQSPTALSPAEIARKNKQQLRNLALEWGI